MQCIVQIFYNPLQRGMMLFLSLIKASREKGKKSNSMSFLLIIQLILVMFLQSLLKIP